VPRSSPAEAPELFDLFGILPKPLPTIRVVDVGAMMLGAEVYDPLRKSGVAQIIGFEPQQAECEKLNATYGPQGHTYLPYFVGDGSPRTFYLTRHAASASLYEPNLPLVAKFQTLAEAYEVMRTEPVQTRRLDEIEQARPADLIKLDTQGAELDVIRGGTETIREALVVHSEVEFVPMYKEQPLFAEIDQEMRELGFSFLKFYSVAGRAFVPLLVENDPSRRISQMLWANAVYIRDFMRLDRLSPPQLIKLAIIAHELYGAVDLAHVALAEHDRTSGTALATAYLGQVTQPSRG
jgi:FkbM family methyltransferase